MNAIPKVDGTKNLFIPIKREEIYRGFVGLLLIKMLFPAWMKRNMDKNNACEEFFRNL